MTDFGTPGSFPTPPMPPSGARTGPPWELPGAFFQRWLDTAKSILVLPSGSEINILSERGDWIYAALPNDQRGWIPASSAQRVRM